MRKFVFFALVSLSVSLVASAHQRGAMAPAMLPPGIHAMPAAPVSGGHATSFRAPAPVHSGVHVAASGTKPVVSHKQAGYPAPPRPLPPSSGAFASDTFSPGAGLPFFDNSNPVPGLGFDYVHFFAVHPNWGATHPVSGVVVPFFGGGGFYMPTPYYTESTPQEEAQGNVSSKPSDSNRQANADQQAAAAPSRSSFHSNSYVEAVPEFVFIKRDGTTLFAVAYSLLNDRIQYVTKDGLRRSVALDALDFDATQKSNEDRGNTVHLPAFSAPADI